MPVNYVDRLRDIVTSRNIAGYYNERNISRRPYLGASLFPSKKQAGREIKTVKGKAGTPVVLRASAFDTNAPIRDRIPLQAIKNEMPFFRESMLINEETRQFLLLALAAGDQYVNALLTNVFDEQLELLLGADAAVERMRMSLLATGQIDILDAKDNVPIVADYGFDATKQVMTLTGNATWNNPSTAKPLEDIRAAMESVLLDSATAVMTMDTFTKLMACESIKGAMFTPATTPSFITYAALENYLLTQLHVRLVVLRARENTYRTISNPEKDMKFFPDGTFTLIPDGISLGRTIYGTTPEEADLMAGSQADVSIVNTGVAVTTLIKPHPVNVETIVSQVALPSFERIEDMVIINAYTPAG